MSFGATLLMWLSLLFGSYPAPGPGRAPLSSGGQGGGSAGALARQCSDGVDNDGDGLIDWFGNDTGGATDEAGLHGDMSCPTPDWPLGECNRPECAPASNAAGIGLASISPAVPAWPGAYKTPGTGGCPSGNTISSPGVYSYCQWSGQVTISAQNVTCYGCRIRFSSATTSFALWVSVSNSNLRWVYGLIEPSNPTPPWTCAQAYQFGIFRNFANGAAAAPWTFERSTLRGYGNAINIDGSGCNATHPCTVRGTTIGYPRESAIDGCTDKTTDDHTDGLGCTTPDASCTSGAYVTLTGSALLGHYIGSGASANTNAIGMQGPNGTYDHHLLTHNYISGWNASIDYLTSNTNMLFANNWFGTEWAPLNNVIVARLSTSGTNTWANNRWNYTTDSGRTWVYPTPSDDNKFWYPSDSGTAAKHTTDFNGNTQFPYPEPACDDGIDNDLDGSIDYPWDATCTTPWDTSEGTVQSPTFPTTWAALTDSGFYPSAANTGVPPGMTLTATSARSINVAGTVIDGEIITGQTGGSTGYGLLVNANNVTIKRTKIVTSFGTGTGVNASGGIKIAPGVTGTVIQDVEIDGSNATHTCVFYEGNGITIQRMDCHNVCDGVFSWDGDNFSILDSYIHDLSGLPSNGHTDGFQTEGAQHGTIQHNTIDIARTDTGTISIWNSRRNSTDILVDNNLLSGAGAIFYAEDYNSDGVVGNVNEANPVGGFTTTNIRHTNNKISVDKRWGTGGGNAPFKCGGYYEVYFHTANAYNGGPTDGWTRTGNVIIETGASVNTEIPGCG